MLSPTLDEAPVMKAEVDGDSTIDDSIRIASCGYSAATGPRAVRANRKSLKTVILPCFHLHLWELLVSLIQNPKPVLSFAEGSRIQNFQTISIPFTPMT